MSPTAINAAGSGWGVTVLGLSLVVLTMVFRRGRHLLVFLGSLLFLEIVGQSIYFGLSRPRPYGVPIIGSWGGYSGVSPPVAVADDLPRWVPSTAWSCRAAPAT